MVRRTHCYADGGKVVADHSESEYESPTYGRALIDRARRMVGMKDSTPAPKKKATPTPADLGTGGAAKAADTLANKRKKQMEDLGL